jgi:hypothetical protein
MLKVIALKIINCTLVPMLRSIVLAMIFFFASALNGIAGEAVQERTLEIPGRGMLVLSVPATWSHQIGQPPEEIAPTIRFSATAEKKFSVSVTAFWSPKKDASFNSSKNVRSIVESTLDELKSQIVEKQIRIHNLTGGSRAGYYISATVKAPGPGEFKFLTQGAISVEDLLLTFTALTNEKPSTIISRLFEMLQSAKRGT